MWVLSFRRILLKCWSVCDACLCLAGARNCSRGMGCLHECASELGNHYRRCLGSMLGDAGCSEMIWHTYRLPLWHSFGYIIRFIWLNAHPWQKYLLFNVHLDLIPCSAPPPVFSLLKMNTVVVKYWLPHDLYVLLTCHSRARGIRYFVHKLCSITLQ